MRRRRFMISSEKANINDFLTIVALEDETTIELTLYNGSYGFYNPECSINGGDWFEYTTKISINQGDTLSLRAYGYVIGSSSPLSISKKFNAIGKTESLGNECNYLFSGQDIVDASLLKVSNVCYHMFDGCTSLTTAPKLPATTLSNGCYGYMFRGCTSLTTAPELPATTLADYCYDHMFYGCTNLTAAPELPATTLAANCYYCMFYGCTKLNYIKMLATDISARYCLPAWVYGVASSGTFVKNPAMNSLPTGTDGIPSGWTVVNDGEESGGDTGWSFTLPLVGTGEGFEDYELNNDGDPRISELFNLLVENSYFEPYPSFGGTWWVNEEWLQENPIYINGDMLTMIYCDIELGDDSNRPDMFFSYSPFFMDITFHPDFIGATRHI